MLWTKNELVGETRQLKASLQSLRDALDAAR